MALDRSSIQRTDFPTARRGYEPAAVDAHLREVADQVEGVRRAAAQPVAAAASSQVQRIIEVAETTAEQLRTEAREETEQLRAEAGGEAREHVQRVSTAARELLQQIGTLQQELGGILGRLHDDAARLSSELRALERDVGELGPPQDEDDDEVEPEPEPEPAAEDEEPELEIEIAAPTGSTRVNDEEAARLVALDMALGGTPREETEQYLAQHYALSNADKLLDDVYTLAGS
ncbi:MAG: DivIVA domain-containing protein [Solirubrobacteraceae bacterium]